MGAEPIPRLAPPPCIGAPPPALVNPLVRYVTVKRSWWSEDIRRQITNTTVGYIATTLANYGDKYGRECWPGVERLAEDVFCVERTVIRAMNWLAEYGFVHLHKRGARKLKEANHYHLAIPAPLAARRGLWAAEERWWTEEPAQRHMRVLPGRASEAA